MQRLQLPIPPSVNHYKVYYCTRSTPTDTHIVSASTSAASKQYKKAAGWEAKAVGVRVEEEADMKVEVHLYPGHHHVDSDNLLKVLIDSFIGIAYRDDKQVAEIFFKRHKPDGRARLEVIISKVED